MKTLGVVTVIVFLTVVHTSAILAQQITIDQIIADKQISGYVGGLQPTDYPDYKVIVYVHTDQWYVHPYAGQGEGLSWASIKKNGTWQIQTVQRKFKADKVAALLVKRDYPEPSKVKIIKKIPHSAILVKKLQGTPDYGKL